MLQARKMHLAAVGAAVIYIIKNQNWSVFTDVLHIICTRRKSYCAFIFKHSYGTKRACIMRTYHASKCRSIRNITGLDVHGYLSVIFCYTGLASLQQTYSYSDQERCGNAVNPFRS